MRIDRDPSAPANDAVSVSDAVSVHGAVDGDPARRAPADAASRRVDRRLGAAGGALAGICGLLGGGAVAAIGGWNPPIVSVGNRVVDRVPLGLKEFAIRTFGTDDKTVLKATIAVVVVVAAAVAGALAVRRFSAAVAMAGTLALIGGLAATLGRDASSVDVVPVLVAAVSALGALWLLLRRTRRTPVPVRMHTHDSSTSGAAEPMPTRRSDVAVDRRAFLRAAGIVGGAGAASFVVSRARSGDDEPVLPASATSGTAVDGTAAAPFARAREPLPAPPRATAVDVAGMTPFLTPTRDFYRIDTALLVPKIDAAGWELEIGGRVARPRTFTYEQLLARPLVEADMTLMCVSNEIGGDLIGNARFLGVPLAELLDEVEPDAEADQLASWSADGWSCGFPTALARDGRNALVAIGMNGEPLTRTHGFPARLVVPGIYGYVSATKWLTRIELTRQDDFDGYWIDKGWAKQAPIKTGARIDVPQRRAELRAGKVPIAGVAWAQHTGISKVEVQIDGGEWHEAALAADGGVDCWRQWKLVWEATPGTHGIRVRATDAHGATQPEERTPVAPDGATGWHTISVTVR